MRENASSAHYCRPSILRGGVGVVDWGEDTERREAWRDGRDDAWPQRLMAYAARTRGHSLSLHFEGVTHAALYSDSI